VYSVALQRPHNRLGTMIFARFEQLFALTALTEFPH